MSSADSLEDTGLAFGMVSGFMSVWTLMLPGEVGAASPMSASVLDLGVEVGESASLSFLAPNTLFKKPEDLFSTLFASLMVEFATGKCVSLRAMLEERTERAVSGFSEYVRCCLGRSSFCTSSVSIV